MENETFKVAKEILEKFAPSQLLPKYLANQQAGLTPNRPGASPGNRTPITNYANNNPNLRRRTVPSPGNPVPSFTPRLPAPGQYFRQQSNSFRPALMPPPTPANSHNPTYNYSKLGALLNILPTKILSLIIYCG